jgi:hypothetical protein
MFGHPRDNHVVVSWTAQKFLGILLFSRVSGWYTGHMPLLLMKKTRNASKSQCCSHPATAPRALIVINFFYLFTQDEAALKEFFFFCPG